MVIKKLLQGFKKNKPLTYEKAKELARHEDVDVRLELARRADVKPELLYYLAEDKDPTVRRAIATNVATPRMADLMLAEDEDGEVRVGMSEKIALLAPGLSADEQDSIRKMTYEALQILARDQMTRVRQILSDTLKDVADAPPDVIRRLARDVELVVSGPVLEFSPVLTTEDLLEIIANEPIGGALRAVSRRYDLGAAVSTSIANSNDQEAITELLANKSAQIREETLNNLVERAVDFESWHEPLARRPTLPAGAAGRLARFVAGNLLDILTAREDLDAATAEEVRNIVNRRLDERSEPAIDDEPSEFEGIAPGMMKKARELDSAGKLNADCLNKALQNSERDFAAAALVVMSKQEEKIVVYAISTRSAEAIIAIAWKASLEPWLVEQLQLRLCKIPNQVVLTTPAGQDYPLSEDEMISQLNFLKDMTK